VKKDMHDSINYSKFNLYANDIIEEYYDKDILTSLDKEITEFSEEYKDYKYNFENEILNKISSVL
jgi:hypothetical protein